MVGARRARSRSARARARQDVRAATGFEVAYPAIGDEKYELTDALGVARPMARPEDGAPEEGGGGGGGGAPARAADPERVALVLGADKRVKMALTYPPAVGMNFHEVLRCVDALQLADGRGVLTPVNWVRGQDVFVAEGVPVEEARRAFPRGVHLIDLPSTRDYLRVTPDPLVDTRRADESDAPAMLPGATPAGEPP